MFELVIQPVEEYFDDETSTFHSFKGQTIPLEHSLISISKWEAIWHKPFLTKEPMTIEQTRSYIECMALNPKYDKKALMFVTKKNIDDIMEYIQDPMTATMFYETKKSSKKGDHKIVTSEQIYFQMIELGIPVEFEKWHLNRLTTLIHIFNIEHQSDNKLKGNELIRQNYAINQARRAQAEARAKTGH